MHEYAVTHARQHYTLTRATCLPIANARMLTNSIALAKPHKPTHPCVYLQAPQLATAQTITGLRRTALYDNASELRTGLPTNK